jgi:hypothetical protein
MKILKRLGLGLLIFIGLCWAGLAAWAYWPGEPELPVARLATAEDRFVEVEGVRLRYREWGRAAADRPSLLLMSSPSTWPAMDCPTSRSISIITTGRRLAC